MSTHLPGTTIDLATPEQKAARIEAHIEYQRPVHPQLDYVIGYVGIWGKAPIQVTASAAGQTERVIAEVRKAAAAVYAQWLDEDAERIARNQADEEAAAQRRLEQRIKDLEACAGRYVTIVQK